MTKADLEQFCTMVRAALSEPVATHGREPVFWSNEPGSNTNELAAKAYCALYPATTILISDTEAGRVVRALIAQNQPSKEQADVIWGLLSHRFAMQADGTVHAFVSNSTTGRIFRAVEARELGERKHGQGLVLHEGTTIRFIENTDVLTLLASDEGDFFVTRDSDEQLVVMEEAERVRPRRSGT